MLAADNIGSEAPEKSSGKHTNVNGNGESIPIALLSKFAVSLCGNDGLE